MAGKRAAMMAARARSHLKCLARALLRGRNGSVNGPEFTAPDWDLYQMDLERPFARLESVARERRIVDAALEALCGAGILQTTTYGEARYQAMRALLEARFDIPWTAITPRMQRLIYAINATHRPAVMIAAGVFCGNTFMSNAGAAVGPGAVYEARHLVGLEIDATEAARAERNVRLVDSTGVARILAQDAIAFCRAWSDNIDLLYIDADEFGGRGKSIYLDIAREAWAKIPVGGLLLAHNSVNDARELASYLDFVRNRRNCRASMNLAIDSEGLEVSIK